MKVYEMRPYVKSRLKQRNKCCVCGKPFLYDDNIIYFTKRIGRCKQYTFCHYSCAENILTKGGKYGKEKTKS